MILILVKVLDHNLVAESEDENEGSVEHGWQELERERHIVIILIIESIVPVLHTDLSNNDCLNKQYGNRYTYEHISPVSVIEWDLIFSLGLLINCPGAFKGRSLMVRILEFTHQPRVSDDVLLALPTFSEKSCPDYDKDGVEEV